MTETDATVRPLTMPERFLPYLEKYRIYKIFKEMAEDVIINLPKDHLKHMRTFLGRRMYMTQDPERVMMLISPGLQIDIKGVIQGIIKEQRLTVITRLCVVDRLEKHDDYEPGCISPVMMSKVTRQITEKESVAELGWLMFDHPCTVREARCMQQDGVIPTVTLVLAAPPTPAPLPENPFTPSRSFFTQDFEGLKFAYKATLKEVHIGPEDETTTISHKCLNAIRACSAGLQHTRHGHNVIGAPGVYRVLLIGPRGSGCRTQAAELAKCFGLIYLNYEDIYLEAKEGNDEVGQKLRAFGLSPQLKAEIIKRRLLKKDCIDYGWVLSGFPTSGLDFEHLDNFSTPPNRVIFLNVDRQTCKNRLMSIGVDWCTGMGAVPGSGPRVLPHPSHSESQIELELEYYFTEALPELRAAAGITAVEVDAKEPYERVQVKIQAAVMAAPPFDIQIFLPTRDVQIDYRHSYLS